MQGFWGDFWILSRALIADDDCTICSYFIFRLSALFPSAIDDHCTAHINRVIFFSQIRRRGENEIFSMGVEQELEKEEKEIGL